MTWTALAELMAHRWGDFASLLGLIVSAMTLSVAAKAREAAEATRAAARRQNLTEVLQDAARIARIAQAHGLVTQLLNAELGEALRSAEGSR